MPPINTHRGHQTAGHANMKTHFLQSIHLSHTHTHTHRPYKPRGTESFHLMSCELFHMTLCEIRLPHLHVDVIDHCFIYRANNDLQCPSWLPSGMSWADVWGLRVFKERMNHSTQNQSYREPGSYSLWISCWFMVNAINEWLHLPFCVAGVTPGEVINHYRLE